MSIGLRTQVKRAPSVSFAPVRSGLLQRKCACGGTPGPTGECEECRKKRLGLQRKSAQVLGFSNRSSQVPPIVHEVIRSPGKPLDPATRSIMESHFRKDFSHIRIHTDPKDARSADHISALAYTFGRHIVFGPGQYSPHNAQGQSLIAHELAHVVQHAMGQSTSGESPTAMAPRGSAAEQEAASVSQMSKKTPLIAQKLAASTVARLDVPLWSCPRRLAPIALRQAQTSGLPGLHNGPADAYRHCFWSCEMVKQCSWPAAYVAGTGHELTGWTANESEMDLNNNAAGRDCGDQIPNCDKCCRDKLAAGQLTVLTTGDKGSAYYEKGNMGYRGISDTQRASDPRRY